MYLTGNSAKQGKYRRKHHICSEVKGRSSTDGAEDSWCTYHNQLKALVVRDDYQYLRPYRQNAKMTEGKYREE
jgi:hypothetical protein